MSVGKFWCDEKVKSLKKKLETKPGLTWKLLPSSRYTKFRLVHVECDRCVRWWAWRTLHPDIQNRAASSLRDSKDSYPGRVCLFLFQFLFFLLPPSWNRQPFLVCFSKFFQTKEANTIHIVKQSIRLLFIVVIILLEGLVINFVQPGAVSTNEMTNWFY